MLKRVTINNFQSHEDTTFDLSKGMSVIVGASDAGKSALARAIQCVIRRTPFYLNWRPNITEGFVELEFDDCVISRHYKKVSTTVCPTCKAKLGTNKAKCQECNSLVPDKPAHDYYMMDGVKYERFGVNLPDEIINKIKMCEIDFSGLKVNINTQNQFDDNFFIGSTFNGTNRNKLIGGLIPDSDIIGEVITECNEDKNSIRAENKYLENEHKQSVKKLEDVTDDIKAIELLYKEISDIETTVNEYNDKLNKLYKIKTDLNELKSLNLLQKFIPYCDKFKQQIHIALSKYEHDIELLHDINKWSNLFKTATNTIEEFKISSDLVNEFKQFNSLLDEYIEDKQRYKSLNSIDVKDIKDIGDISIPEFKTATVEQFILTINQLQDKITKIKYHGDRVNELNTIVNELNLSLKKENKLKEETINTFKKDNPTLICPEINDVYCEECLLKLEI